MTGAGSYSMQSRREWTDAVRARAAEARDRSNSLVVASWQLCETVRATRYAAAVLVGRPRRTVGGRRPKAASSHDGVGRVTRRRERRAGAASEARRPDDGKHPSRTQAHGWAHATVLGSRSVSGAHVWTVRELDAAGIPGARGPRCLVFENAQLVRRLWEYPPDWAALPDATLLHLADLSE